MIKSKINPSSSDNNSRASRQTRPLSSNPTISFGNKVQHRTSHNNRVEKENHKIPKEKSNQLTAMKNRISYIERESQKNLTRIQLKQERLAYLRSAKAEADARERQLQEAQQQKKQVLLNKKQGVSMANSRRRTRLSSIKQQLIEDKQEAYRKAKAEKEALKKKKEELAKKTLESNKKRVKRKGSLRRSMIFSVNNCSSQVNLYDTPVKRKIQRKMTAVKQTADEYGFDKEEFEREVEKLEKLEREKLDKLAMTVKEKQRIEQNFNELMNYRGEQH